jgi:gamma-polyglutamate biosynthesis protein CapC
MPDWLFPLPIFPEGSLSSSVITTVWVGVFVIAFFNLRFGWVLSGLVVPGYLVPLLIARPFSFGVILVEAALTYFIVWLFSERLSGGRSWSSFFGRDRFVALVLVSILVRLAFDGWLLPILAVYLQENWATTIDWTANLHSFGLIVISLLANQLWKPGFLRGMSQALVTIGLTWLVVRFGLMELTNFRISAVAYLYEDLASSILASPKAYIILVTTAILASRMNLRYGWDFNGVLIPALIALQWYQPLKVLTSFVEAFVIYGLAILLLRLPAFSNLTIEGARKILLFFNISFAYRLLMGHALFWGEVDVKITDYYGFGYLLSTLMAIKMFDKDILARLSRATLQISATGVVLGSAIAFALTLAVPPVPTAPGATAGQAPEPDERRLTLAGFLGDRAAAAYGAWRIPEGQALTPGEFETFREGARLILGSEAASDRFEHGLALMAAVGFRAERLEGGRLALIDAREGREGGAFLIDPRAASDLLLSLPDPIAAPGLALAAEPLMAVTGARALAISGRSGTLVAGGGGAPGETYATFFQAFHEGAETGILQVRARQDADGDPRLRISRRLPPGLEVASLAEALGGLDTAFGREGERSRQEAAGAGGFATLWLDETDIRRLLDAGASPSRAPERIGIRSYLLGLVAEGPPPSPPPAELGTLLYFDREVLTPLLRDVLPHWGENARRWRSPRQTERRRLSATVSRSILIRTRTRRILSLSRGLSAGGSTPSGSARRALRSSSRCRGPISSCRRWNTARPSMDRPVPQPSASRRLPRRQRPTILLRPTRSIRAALRASSISSRRCSFASMRSPSWSRRSAASPFRRTGSHPLMMPSSPSICCPRAD